MKILKDLGKGEFIDDLIFFFLKNNSLILKSEFLDKKFLDNIGELVRSTVVLPNLTLGLHGLKRNLLNELMTVSDFIEQVKAIKHIYDKDLIDKPESVYETFSKLSSTKAYNYALKDWKRKIEEILPYLPESRRQRPYRSDFFEEQVLIDELAGLEKVDFFLRFLY